MQFPEKYPYNEIFNQIYKQFCIFSQYAKKHNFRKRNEQLKFN